ncbi:unnamed protein product [Sphenostylis stenocarpa]|uniref:Uncharacterized protein n=1 Tax=Sphenostylis stenocarpa TaxID=92480 RepID=A0AA86VYG4_9FABA|nr:unnamed protein product [Sphenostylis stenocarpa]
MAKRAYGIVEMSFLWIQLDDGKESDGVFLYLWQKARNAMSINRDQSHRQGNLSPQEHTGAKVRMTEML